MTKDYTDRLAKWVGQRSATKRDKNVAAFLAVREDVTGALHAGFAARTIWINLFEEGRVPFRYTTFLSLVKRHIDRTEGNQFRVKAIQTHALPKALRNKNLAVQMVETTESGQPRGFVFNPIPRKEDLI